GFIQAARGERDSAEKAFKEALARDPKSVNARLALAQFYWMTGNSSRAEDTLRDIINIEPGNAAANRALAAFYMATNRQAEAEVPLRRYVDEDRSAAARLTLADYLARQGRSHDAAEQFKAIQNDPRFGKIARVR